MRMSGAADEIRRLSEQLARDPGAPAFLPLAELLMDAGELEAAGRVLRGGVRRHPRNPEAHAALARLMTERGDWDDAVASWDEAARLAGCPSPLAAHARQAQAYLRFRQRRWADADAFLDAAAAAGGEASAIAAARAHVRRELGDPSGRTLFDSLLEGGDLAALLVAPDGGVAAGRCDAPGGRDAAPEVARELAVVGEEATRAMRHLALGSWQSVMVETSVSVVGLAPVGGGVALVAIDAGVPLGRLRRLLDRVAERATAWGTPR